MAPNSWWKICNGAGKDLKTDQNVVTVTINGRGCVMMSHWCKSNNCVEHKWTTTLAIYVKKVITHTYTWEMKERERAGNTGNKKWLKRDHGTSSPHCCWALAEWGRGPRPLGWIFVPYPPPHLLKPSSIRFWIETESTAEGPGRIGFRQPGIVHVCQCVPVEKRGACERGGGIMHKLQIKAKEKRNGKNVFVLQNPVCGNHVWFHTWKTSSPQHRIN